MFIALNFFLEIPWKIEMSVMISEGKDERRRLED
jgi:hypothetical protein